MGDTSILNSYMSRSKSNKKTWDSTPPSIKKERFKKISQKLTGRSKTGDVNWDKVKKIRQLWYEGRSRKQIHDLFPELSIYTINDITARRTWKEPLVKPRRIQTDF